MAFPNAFIARSHYVAGARLKDGRDLRAALPIAADGRSSLVRSSGLLAVETLGAPMDVFWFRLRGFDPKLLAELNATNNAAVKMKSSSRRAAETKRVAIGVRPGGNFEGRSILHVTRPLVEVAQALGRDQDDIAGLGEEIEAQGGLEVIEGLLGELDIPSARMPRFGQFCQDAPALLVRSGRFHRQLDVVPHARTQSCGAWQGPIQRRLRLASFELHSTPGPVAPQVKHLGADVAADLLEQQSARARTARAIARDEWLGPPTRMA